jgi:hypothetical protein
MRLFRMQYTKSELLARFVHPTTSASAYLKQA